MPLEKGPVGSAAFGRNVATEVKAGKPQKQAVAIAYNEASEKKDCTMTDRLDSIMDSVSKMVARVDALCAGRSDTSPRDQEILNKAAARNAEHVKKMQAAWKVMKAEEAAAERAYKQALDRTGDTRENGIRYEKALAAARRKYYDLEKEA